MGNKYVLHNPTSIPGKPPSNSNSHVTLGRRFQRAPEWLILYNTGAKIVTTEVPSHLLPVINVKTTSLGLLSALVWFTVSQLSVVSAERQDARALLENGKRILINGNFDTQSQVNAEPFLNEAIQMEPNLAEAYYLRARCNGASSEALRDYKKAIGLSPRMKQVWGKEKDSALAYVLYNQGLAGLSNEDNSTRSETLRAIRFFTKSIKTHEYAAAYVDRAKAYIRIGSYNKALNDADCLGRLNRKVEQLTIKSLVKLKTRDYSGAIADATAALSLSQESNWPTNPRYAREQAFESIGDWKSALSDCNEMLKTNPFNPYILKQRAMALEKLGRESDAVADLENAAAELEKKGLAMYRPDDLLKDPLYVEITAKLKSLGKVRVIAP